MTFSEALDQLKQGKVLTRKYWKDSEIDLVILFNPNGFFTFVLDKSFTDEYQFTIDDQIIDDWEIAP